MTINVTNTDRDWHENADGDPIRDTDAAPLFTPNVPPADPAASMRDIPFAKSDPAIAEDMLEARSVEARHDQQLAAMLLGLDKTGATEHWTRLVTPEDAARAISALCRTLHRERNAR